MPSTVRSTGVCNDRRQPTRSFTGSRGKMVPLPNGRHLGTDEILTALLSGRPDLPTRIPEGPKENSYVLVDNRRNLQLEERDTSFQFVDDRGAWDTCKNSMPHVPYVRQAAGDWRRVFVRNGKYCTERNPSRGVYVYCELEPQPSAAEIVVLRHYYTTLRASGDYRRRITWIDGERGTAALVEYTEKYPGHVSHGNCIRNSSMYSLADPDMLAIVQHWTGVRPPKLDYSDLQAQGMQPRDVQQVIL